ncbi:flagellar hook capping FlgD N-terminal domain-containing protein [Advenella sp. RU8]|uniref:flagellar hook capping FlgD N-terminal domain-containing protein n=1 Tax=Advenella sp. RU8 TaxID=3399575 RepID=UPI003AAE9EBD
MTTINPTSSTSSLAGSASSLGSTSIAETQEQFLTLLVTQLRNQDPLNPMDNAGITSQLAQLSTVSGIEKLNQTVLALTGQLDVSQSMQASNLIGKNVLVPGDTIKLGESGMATPFGVDLMGAAASMKVEIIDAAGNPVRTFDMGPQNVDVISMQWDGLGDNGTQAPAGKYTVRVTALDAANSAVPAEALQYGQVQSISYSTEGMKMDLGLTGRYALTDLRKVMN